MTINLTTLDIRYDQSGSGPDDVEISVAVNGGSATVIHTHDFNDSSSANTVTGLDLSGFTSLQDLGLGDSVVFTLAVFNSESSGGTFDLENQASFESGAGLVLSGDVVPEPSLAFLGLLGACGLFRRRR